MSGVHKFSVENGQYHWEEVEGEDLQMEGVKSVTKHVLIGEKDKAPNMIMRYFHVKPKGHSRLERHPQEHEVIVLHGQGAVQIADKTVPLKAMDVVFVEGNELHQFTNTGDEDFGFICVIPASS